jgi:hypothetical protein
LGLIEVKLHKDYKLNGIRLSMKDEDPEYKNNDWKEIVDCAACGQQHNIFLEVHYANVFALLRIRTEPKYVYVPLVYRCPINNANMKVTMRFLDNDDTFENASIVKVE